MTQKAADGVVRCEVPGGQRDPDPDEPAPTHPKGALRVDAERTKDDAHPESGPAVFGGEVEHLDIGAHRWGATLGIRLLDAISSTIFGHKLIGIGIGGRCVAGVSLVLVLAETQATNVLIWLMGSVGGRGWAEVSCVALLTGIGLLPLLSQARALDAFSLGEEHASALGVSTERVKLITFAAVALLVAAAVSFCGLIGFVGLIVPHGVRMIVGPGHRKLLFLSAIAGAFVLVSADLCARVLLTDRELPIGVITGCLGGPFFLVLLRRSFLSAGR